MGARRDVAGGALDVRHRRPRRTDGRRAAARDARTSQASRARRLGNLLVRRRRARHDAPGDHRPGDGPAAHERSDRALLDRLQRRDLQLPPAPDDARSRRAPLPNAERHRGYLAIVRRVRRGVCRALPGHVRFRHLGYRPASAVPGARSTGEETPLLLASRPPLPVRVGAQGAALSSGGLARARLAGVPALPRVRLHAGRPVDLRFDREAAAGAHRDARGRPPHARSLLAASAGGPGAASARARRERGRDARRIARGRPAAARERRAARRLSLGRPRLERGGRHHARAHLGPHRDLLGGVRRRRGALVRRATVRTHGRPAVRDRPPRGDPRARRARDAPGDRSSVRRAVRRLLGDPDVHRGPGDRAPREGRAVRDRR